MTERRSGRSVARAVGWLVLVVPAMVAAGCAPAAAPPLPGAVTAGARQQGGWEVVERLVDEQKLREALATVVALREEARARGDEESWARALAKEAELRIALHEVEGALAALDREPWPPGARWRMLLHLVRGRALATYLQLYGWEIRRREPVAAAGPKDVSLLTSSEIFQAAQAEYLAAWEARGEVGGERLSAWSEFFEAGTYPEAIRGTVRDAVTYLFVELLADSSWWRPAEGAELYRLDLDQLLAAVPAPVDGEQLRGAELHPLEKLVAVLGDLEAWHSAAGRSDAALEARLERLRRLHAAFSRADDRTRIVASLEAVLEAHRHLAWWSVGQALRAELLAEEDDPEAMIRARQAALAGLQRDPDSVGGQRCRHLVERFEAPEFELVGMASDGPGRPSFRVTHTNLKELYFRAYGVNLEERLAKPPEDGLFPSWREVQGLLATAPPVASWRVALPPTPDLRPHATFVTPPPLPAGAYVVVASLRDDFAAAANVVRAVPFVQSALVLVVRGGEDGGVVATVVEGATGRPRDGVAVALYRADWRGGHRRLVERRSAADGTVTFAAAEMARQASHFLVARQDGQLALVEERLWRGEPQARDGRTRVLLFTDRSVYRPGQTLFFKVVAVAPEGGSGRLRPLTAATVTVQLVDTNGEIVASRIVGTNEFGAAWGEFVVPTGRLLGRWTVQTSLGGVAPIQVEEYRRPTFEVTFGDGSEQARLNRPVRVVGEARYYFGLPLSEGVVRWRVLREPVWRFWWWRTPPAEGERRVVASGVTVVAGDGSFAFSFVPAADEREATTKGTSYRFRVEAEVTDPGGETRTASRVFHLGFVAVEARLDLGTGFVGEGVAHEVRIARTDLDGAPRPGAGTYRLIRLREPERPRLPADEPEEGEGSGGPHATPGDSVRPRWDHKYSPEAMLRGFEDGATLAAGALVHGPDGVAVVVLPNLSAGAYRLRYTTTDEFGATLERAQEFMVGGARTPVALPLALEVDRPTARVGEEVAVLAVSGFEGQPMFLEVHRRGVVVEVRRLAAGRDSSLLRFPIEEAHRGGLAFRLWAVRDHQLMVVERRIAVPFDDREVKLSFATFRDTLRPGQHETFRVMVTDAAGKPLGAGVAEVLAYMYDRSLDTFAPHEPPSVAGLFPADPTLGWELSTLKGAWPLGWEDTLPAPTPYPELTPASLKWTSGYGIGGPGRRRWGAFVAEAPMMAMADGRAAKAEAAEPTLARGPAGPPPAGPTGGAEVMLRSDFAETAFFEPALRTGEDGSVRIEFDVPHAVTAWNLWLHAITRELQGGSLRSEVRTVKELLVRPYLPRFLREGDAAEVAVVIHNASGKPLRGRLKVRLASPDEGADLGDAFGLDPAWREGRPFEVMAASATTLAFAVTAPPRLASVVVTVTAETESFADGEARPLPILPARLHLAQSRFASLPEGATKRLHFEDLASATDPSLDSESLVVTVDGQLFYAALAALPYLADYPYECTEQLLNRFLATGILTSLFAEHPEVAQAAAQLASRKTPLPAWDVADPNRRMALEETPWLRVARGNGDEAPWLRVLDPAVASKVRETSLAKLRQAQTASGGFPWWPGGPPSPYMTLYLMHGFAKAAEFGIDVPRELVSRGWGYLARHLREDAVGRMVREDSGWEFLTYLNYVASCYPDPAWMGDALTTEERRRILDLSFRHWREHSPYLKGMLALTLARMGRQDEARLVFDSVMDAATTTEEEGTCWAAEARSWLWYNDTIETHAQLLRTLAELAPGDPRIQGVIHWLLLNRKLDHWHSTKATAEVLYALARVLSQQGGLAARGEVAVEAGGRRASFVFEPNRVSGRAEHLVLRPVGPASATVVASNRGRGLAFVSATWHFATDRLPVAGRGDLLEVQRQYFRRQRQGREVTLHPLAAGEEVAVGDELEVRLTVRARHPVSYVHLRDPRPGGCEPAVAISSFAGHLGVLFYQEVRESGINFFFEDLPQGEFPLTHRLRVATPGRFTVAPAVLQSMYAPEFVAYSAGTTLLVAAP